MNNKSIMCTVNECKHNCNQSHNCTLEKIEIKSHASTATTPECTDCTSFMKK